MNQKMRNERMGIKLRLALAACRASTQSDRFLGFADGINAIVSPEWTYFV